MKLFTLLLAAALLTGCAAVNKVEEKVLDRLSQDLKRTAEMAEKYGDADVANCAKALQTATAGVEELLSEPTDGLFSAAFKAALLRHVGSEAEQIFIAQCSPMAAKMLVELGRRAPIGIPR